MSLTITENWRWNDCSGQEEIQDALLALALFFRYLAVLRSGVLEAIQRSGGLPEEGRGLSSRIQALEQPGEIPGNTYVRNKLTLPCTKSFLKFPESVTWTVLNTRFQRHGNFPEHCPFLPHQISLCLDFKETALSISYPRLSARVTGFLLKLGTSSLLPPLNPH